MPYVKGENAVSILRQSGKEEMTAEVPVLSYTEKVPVLREEYATLDYYELVHFIPVSLWKEIKGQIGGSEEDTYLCMLGRENVTSEDLDALQGQVDSLIAGNYKTESENRIQEAEAIITVGYLLKTSYVEVGTFLAEAPFIPIMLFMLAIWGIVAFAYYLGWRNIRKINLAEVLRDDTMM